jgi:RNA polymerase sigma factor (sigma-70 family)
MKQLDKKEIEKMNDLAKQNYNQMNVFEQNKFINLIYSNVRRYMYFVFNKIGRGLNNTLQQDKFDGMVQEIVYSLVEILKQGKFNPQKAKFSTVLGTYTQNKVYKEGYLESMIKRKGTLVPLLKENKDGTVTEFLSSDENVEEIIIDSLEREGRILMVRNAISKLKPREQKIIEMRMEEKTLEEIGQEVGVTRERVRQILLHIFSFLKNNLQKQAS